MCEGRGESRVAWSSACSRNAHAKKVLVRRTQLRTHEPAPIYNGAAHTKVERHYSMGSCYSAGLEVFPTVEYRAQMALSRFGNIEGEEI
jgi:hypothetical protein